MGSVARQGYTTSFAFFESLWEAGVTHVFVNLGSDHPSIIEAMVKGAKEKDSFPRIITCPNEMVALSMADGFARLTRKPQCVLVHVDVGTQGLAAAVHNASCGRAPVLIFAGLSPATIEGEYRGSRTEYIHWIQDVPDQKAIVAQYCRYTNEIRFGRNVKQIVNRALQFATSDPAGPVYLYGTREAMEEEIEPYKLEQDQWLAVQPPALPEDAVKLTGDHLINAKSPLLIVGYTGRNADSVGATIKLADLIPGLRVLDTGGSDMCFPGNHPASLGLRYGVEQHIRDADFVLVIDCDVPWIPTQCKPMSSAKIIHIDVDPLKQQMPVFYIPAIARYKADSYTAITQLTNHIQSTLPETTLKSEAFQEAFQSRISAYNERKAAIAERARIPDASLHSTSPISTSQLAATIRKSVPETTIFAVEAVTNAPAVAEQLSPILPKTWINCGGGGLGWSGGGALGIKLASDYYSSSPPSFTNTNKGSFVCQVVGDGTYLFSVPGSVYWIAQRYEIAVLTVVLNNKGWNAPRSSLLLVHPDGEGSKVDNKALNISFEPTPHYAEIAKAAACGKLWSGSVQTIEELLSELPKAVQSVKDGVSAVLEVKLNSDLSGLTKEDLTDRVKAATG